MRGSVWLALQIVLLRILWLYFSTSGRLSVRGSMTALLSLWATAVAVGTITVRTAVLLGGDEVEVSSAALKIGAACSVIPVLSVLIKRAHDLNWPGWELFGLLGPIVNMFIAYGLMHRESFPEANQWGPVPRQSWIPWPKE